MLNVKRARRTAHPYDDLDVIDARAPRFNQAVVALFCGAALITGWWPLAGLIGLQLVVGLARGRRWCLPCVFYFEVVQPRVGEGEIEDARPPRFANILGASALTLASAFHLVGLAAAGWAVIGAVALLAGLAAATGLCVGCSFYRLGARLRGIRPGTTRTIELEDMGATPSGPVVVQFTHPLCTECRTVEAHLKSQGHSLVTVDVSTQRALARKYGVGVVPAAYFVNEDGRVLARLA